MVIVQLLPTLQSLAPEKLSSLLRHSVSLPSSVLPAWVGPVKLGRIKKNLVVLIRDALSRSDALQLRLLKH
ncbi:hypothetical protein BDM02DRAFT_3189449 [Thelephora ganbajun]|uniref:Uncharacterized protein n=1 Tax=Thelephora ganbajun TaxID=370292 RepID=A0ACB6Z826_THEGA|nr:hypothetical protein BDM02DRAFT_3189449 [Thelephora ganbajun]